MMKFNFGYIKCGLFVGVGVDVAGGEGCGWE